MAKNVLLLSFHSFVQFIISYTITLILDKKSLFL